MNKLIKIAFSVIVVFSLSGIYSCINLEETVYDSIVTDNYFNNEAEIVSAMVPAYASLRNFMRHRGLLDLEEVTTDVMVTPTRNYGGWDDGGHFRKMHEHTWTASTLYLEYIWSRAFRWVSLANQLIFQFEILDDMDEDLKEEFIGELAMIRAFGYYHLLNAFGNVPLVTDWEDDNPAPANNPDFYEGRRDVFNLLESDLLHYIPRLNPRVDQTTYGRFNKWASMMLLVKLYMNAEVWTGTPRWQDASDYCDSIINSGHYMLEEDYFTNFIQNNEISKENIFVFPNHPTLHGNDITSYEYYKYHQHFASGPVWGAPIQASNGATAIPSYIHSFDPDDLRLKGWTWGEQINQLTGEVQLSNRAPNNPLIFTIDYVNIFIPLPLKYDYKNALENNGARMCKYQIGPWEAGTELPNDHVVFRYADVLLLKAEALMRLNGGVATTEAVSLVNQVHSRAFENSASHLYTAGTLTMDALLQERAWEFYWEGMRRNDLIRFGKFHRGTWEWYDRSSHGIEKTWYPIPQKEINANPNLTQNPGYN